MTEDIRWKQRFDNFTKALQQLTRFVEKGELNEFELQGLIQCFEYNYELAWNTMKDIFEDQGEKGIMGSRDAIRLAFRRGLIDDGEIWMEMVKGRTLTSHTYNEDVAQLVAHNIIGPFYGAFVAFHQRVAEMRA